jgi:hypothetical protein
MVRVLLVLPGLLGAACVVLVGMVRVLSDRWFPGVDFSGVLGVFARQPLAAGFAGWVAGQGGGCLVALGKRSVTAGVAGGIGLSLTSREPISTRTCSLTDGHCFHRHDFEPGLLGFLQGFVFACRAGARMLGRSGDVAFPPMACP